MLVHSAVDAEQHGHDGLGGCDHLLWLHLLPDA